MIVLGLAHGPWAPGRTSLLGCAAPALGIGLGQVNRQGILLIGIVSISLSIGPIYKVCVSEYGRMNDRLIRVRSTVQIHIGKDAATYGNTPIRGILAYPNQHISSGGAPGHRWGAQPQWPAGRLS